MDVKDLEKDFPYNPEIKTFVEALTPQFANANILRPFDITDRQFKKQAAKIKDANLELPPRQAKQPANWKIQAIIRAKAARHYHWPSARTIPSAANLSERAEQWQFKARAMRTVARSVGGVAMRASHEPVQHRLQEITPEVTAAFKTAEAKLAEQPNIEIAQRLINLQIS